MQTNDCFTGFQKNGAFGFTCHSGEMEHCVMARHATDIVEEAGIAGPGDAALGEQRSARKSGLMGLTADLLLRKHKAKASEAAPIPAPDDGQSSSLVPGLLVGKGEARPSTIAPPGAESFVPDSGNAARDQGSEIELKRVREENASLRATLADRESASSEAAAAAAEARERAHRETQEALSKAERDWKAREMARLAEAETQWRSHAASALAEATRRSERAEMSLAQANARADDLAARRQRDETELGRLREDLAALQATLAERETSLSRAGLAAAEARQRSQQDLDEALADAKIAWKAEEAIRAEAEAAQRVTREGELEELRHRLAVMQATLAESEAKATQLALAAGQVRERSQQELGAALENAKTAWTREEAARLAAAQAEWEEKAAKSVAAARAERNTAQQGKDAELRRLREELAAAKAALAARETRLLRADSFAEPARKSRTPGIIVLRTNRIGHVEDALEPQPDRPARRHSVRDAAVAATLAVSAIFLYPHIAGVVSGLGTMFRHAPAPVAAAAVPAPPPAPKENMAIVDHAGNVRAGPSATAEIVSTVQRGLKVAALERSGNWTLVRIAGDAGNPNTQQGWVYSSFLKDAAAGAEAAPAAKLGSAAPTAVPSANNSASGR